MKLRILDKYIFREIFLSFIFGICAFSAVFIGSGTLFKIAKFITDYGASLSAVVKIFVFSMPSVIIWTFPMSMLLATLLTFGKLSGSSEITISSAAETSCAASSPSSAKAAGSRANSIASAHSAERTLISRFFMKHTPFPVAGFPFPRE